MGQRAKTLILEYKENLEELQSPATTPGFNPQRGRESLYSNLMYTLNPYNNKARVVHWLAYWPFSVLDFIFTDLFDLVYKKLVLVLQNYTENLLQKHKIEAPPSDPHQR